MKNRIFAALAVGTSLLIGISGCNQAAQQSQEGKSENKAQQAEWKDVNLQTQTKDGVVSLVFPDTKPPKDLVVQVLKEGTGAEVAAKDFVIANYTGQVWGNEKHFDSSFKRGAPSGFSLERVIEGWTKGIAGHKVGSQLIVIVPPEMGYGKAGGNANAGIGADDVIAFYVEIVDSYALNQANDPNAVVEADLQALPVAITGENGKPAQVKVKDGQEPPKEPGITVISRGSGALVQEKMLLCTCNTQCLFGIIPFRKVRMESMVRKKCGWEMAQCLMS
ncbi:FKBP-type peptidyl-prolyl cis-trans isomerase [Arcanobacterium hippocoleae]|uniref:FKBP-type peptidyl-prolyl cis-trans isomerase n=1 Tax=Arcanobacterium hippocoleae TaxID=149017 RepID=UPI00333F6C8C